MLPVLSEIALTVDGRRLYVSIRSVQILMIEVNIRYTANGARRPKNQACYVSTIMPFLGLHHGTSRSIPEVLEHFKQMGLPTDLLIDLFKLNHWTAELPIFNPPLF